MASRSHDKQTVPKVAERWRALQLLASSRLGASEELQPPLAGRPRPLRAGGSERRAIGGEGWEIPVEMIGLWWLRDSRRRMTQIR
jgi:hypothetical protein